MTVPLVSLCLFHRSYLSSPVFDVYYWMTVQCLWFPFVFHRSYLMCMYVFGFVVPLAAIIFCYFFIYRAVAVHEKEMGKMAKMLNAEIRQGQAAQKAEIKTAKVAMTIVVTYLMSWLPYATVALIAQFGPVEYVTPYVSEIPVMFAKVSVC